MTYSEATEYLYNSTPVFEHVGASAYKEGLETTITLDNYFGNPHRKYKTIHVAGTNGKGSCSHTIASILQEEGHKVGLYTSPHLVDFRERIKVNGVPVEKEYVIGFIKDYRNFFEPLHPSFFELTTAMAFKYFAEQNVDIAVIEVGLGGRLDCTNIISPILSIITNISFDHVQFLGNTLAKIAREKAGIIKESVPVVIGSTTPETKEVFSEYASKRNAPIVFAEDNPYVLSRAEIGDNVEYNTRIGNIISPLGGEYQEENLNTIIHATEVLKESVIFKNYADSIKAGVKNVIANTGLSGRWQIIKEKPKVVCDTGHNVGGWKYLSRQIKKQKCKTLRIVFGMVDDKDINSVMELLPKNAIYYFTKAKTHRAINESEVMSAGERHGLCGRKYRNVPLAYMAALDDAESDDFIFIGGSSYVVADFMEWFMGQQ